MSSTRLKIGKNTVALKYDRKISPKEVQIKKYFVTSGGAKLMKTYNFRILSTEDKGSVRTYHVVL